jgi:hypothetical protein
VYGRPPGSGAPSAPRPPSASSGGGRAGAPPNFRVYRWSSWSSDRGSFPGFALFLVVLGAVLLIQLMVPDLSLWSLVVLAAGLAFGAAWLVGHVTGATMPALILTAWGLADVGHDVGFLPGGGWGTLFIGLAFLAGWVLARYQGVQRGYALPVGVVLGLVGLAETANALAFDLSLAAVVPVAMIVVGLYLLWQRGWSSRGPAG